MSRWEGKPFGYLEGMEPAADAPVMDNPARIYCPQCRADGKLVCAEPAFCGNMRPMKKPQVGPDEITSHQPYNPPVQPRRGSKELQGRPVVQLDDTQGQEPLERIDFAVGRPKKQTQTWRADEVFPERLMGRRTTIRQLPDGEEQSWDWFMENLDPEKWQ